MSRERRKVLFVASHRPERAPNQRFRFEQYFPFLEEQGYDPELSYLIDEETDRKLYSKGKLGAKLRFVIDSYIKRKKDLERIEDHDIVFVSREALMIRSTMFEKGVARSPTPMVLDIDDAVWLPNVSGNNARFGWVKGAGKLHKSFRYADLIIAGNRYLASYAGQYNANVRVIPTTIDTSYHRPLDIQRDERICIGWTGSPTTVPHFELALPYLEKIKELFGDRIRFKLIGDGDYYNENLGLQGQAWKKKSEVEDLADIDIGIMPLPDTEWAKGKCALKALQYMAMEVPPVVSPVGVNPEVVEDGVNGYTPNTGTEWVEALDRLIRDEELRRSLGVAARRTVEERYSVEANKQDYLQVLEDALSSKG
ncbi:MAG: glycosyltransferase family 4 protein [Flavobacteriales bacterium]